LILFLSFPTRRSSDLSSAGWPEIGLDAVARLHGLERLLRGLELVGLAVGLLDRHFPGGRINLHDPPFDFLRSIRLGLLVGRAERSEEHTSELQSPDHL